jgi:glycosyltransferase involved in cell wall biosynthesis
VQTSARAESVVAALRVCIVTVASYAHGIGGMQAHSADLCRGLVEAGHEVEAIAPRHPDGVEKTTHAGGTWHFLDVPSRLPGRPMRHRGWLSRSADAFSALHAEHPFDVVHSESTSALGLLRRGVGKHVPVVAKFHGNYVGLLSATIRRARGAQHASDRVAELKHLVWISGHHFVPLDAIFRFRACEAIVPSAQQARGTARSYLLAASRLHVVPNGIDTEEFRAGDRAEARAALGLPGEDPLLICVGRLAPDKGVEVAIRALEGLDARVRLVVVGGGEEREELERLAAERGLSERVVFAGRQPQELVPTYLSAADIFLFPTQREEAAPLVLPQAMACELPAVASSIGGITEVIDQPGENGILVPPGDVAALRAAVAPLLQDGALRERMGRAARARVEAEYTIERMVDGTLAIYRLALARMRTGHLDWAGGD